MYIQGCIDSYCIVADEVNAGICKVQFTFANLEHLWRQDGISKNMKESLYQAAVRAVLLYGCGIWPVRAAKLRRLQVFDNRCLRIIARVDCCRRIRILAIRKRFSVVQLELPLWNASITRRRLGRKGQSDRTRVHGHPRRLKSYTMFGSPYVLTPRPHPTYLLQLASRQQCNQHCHGFGFESKFEIKKRTNVCCRISAFCKGCGVICPRKMPAEALSSGDRAEDTTAQYNTSPPDKADISNNCDLTIPQKPIKTIEPCPKFGDTQSGDQQHSQEINLLLQKASQYEERRQWENALQSLESCLFLLQTTTDAYKNEKVSTAVRIAWLKEFCGQSGVPVLDSWVHAMRLARAYDEQKLGFVCARRVLHHVCCLYGGRKVNEVLSDLHRTAESQESGQYKVRKLQGDISSQRGTIRVTSLKSHIAGFGQFIGTVRTCLSFRRLRHSNRDFALPARLIDAEKALHRRFILIGNHQQSASHENPQSVLLNGIGLIYMRTGDYLKALNAFQNALNCEVHYSPNTRASLWQNLGTAHSAMGRHELAIEALITALKLYIDQLTRTFIGFLVWLSASGYQAAIQTRVPGIKKALGKLWSTTGQKSMYEGEAQACYNLGCVLTAMPSKNSLARWYFVLARRAAQIARLERIVDLANKAIAAIDRSSQQTLKLNGTGRSSITNFVFEMESPPNSVLSYLQTMQGFEENDEAFHSSGSFAATFDGFLMGRIQHSDNGTEGGATDLISLTADGDQKDQLTQGRLTPTSQYTALELLSGRQEDEYSRFPSEDQKTIRQDSGETQDREDSENPSSIQQLSMEQENSRQSAVSVIRHALCMNKVEI
ncbi:hypothetical protein CLF_111128 [Clonorchis sinensis]|uniref:Uncharacterized protein n=1 Tax=Clonorchis sinensis TaxID=79923 RepID=G7YLF2_CLOSI|nr:hypothetical protein CLF_111128 [Clonorchis sinensis]